ncbi:MAG: SWIM zinc finger family protein, partial [Spirochaetia bacterium]
MDLCETQDAFEQWRSYLSRFELDRLFDNPALKQRARGLYHRNSCIFHTISPELFSAEVIGIHAVYWVELHRRGTQVRGECSCPSYYKPCKHIGALLYTIQSPPVIDDYRPGEILEVTPVDAPQQEEYGSSVEDPYFSELMLPRTLGNCSETACFRLAFRLIGDQNFQQTTETQLFIEPVLVYLRKNGADGRIVEFKPGIFRRRGDEDSEELLSRIAGSSNFQRSERDPSDYPPSDYRSRAIGLCRYWCTEAFRRGAATMEIPVELYLERPSRLEREQPAVPRRIIRIGISWRLERQYQQQLYYWPILELYDERDYSEKFDAGQLIYEHDVDSLLVVTPSTGSLWHLFQLEIPEAEPGKIQAAATMLYMLTGFTAAEARTFSDLCRSRFSGLVEVAPVPLNVRIISLVPTPIANFHMIG